MMEANIGEQGKPGEGDRHDQAAAGDRETRSDPVRQLADRSRQKRDRCRQRQEDEADFGRAQPPAGDQQHG
ncbi:hypothetical protein X742_03830 [Mesorhizobium sp. LNHC232B00]|nr:hypothetical protein X742_03830 [Mesorhizobium sp. LNHC232B00]